MKCSKHDEVHCAENAVAFKNGNLMDPNEMLSTISKSRRMMHSNNMSYRTGSMRTMITVGGT